MTENGIRFSDVRKFAKMLDIDIEGKAKAKAMEMVLDAVVDDYEKNQENLGKDEFQDYKKTSSDMLNWYNKHKAWEGKKGDPEAGFTDDVDETTDVDETSPPAPERRVKKGDKAKAKGKAKEKGKAKTKKEKDLSEAKNKAKKAKEAKAKAAKDKAKAKKGNGKGHNIGIGDFVRKGLKDGSFKNKTDEQIAEKALKKLGGTTELRSVKLYVRRIRQGL